METIGFQEILSLIKTKTNPSPPNFGSNAYKEWDLSNFHSLIELLSQPEIISKRKVFRRFHGEEKLINSLKLAQYLRRNKNS